MPQSAGLKHPSVHQQARKEPAREHRNQITKCRLVTDLGGAPLTTLSLALVLFWGRLFHRPRYVDQDANVGRIRCTRVREPERQNNKNAKGERLGDL